MLPWLPFSLREAMLMEVHSIALMRCCMAQTHAVELRAVELRAVELRQHERSMQALVRVASVRMSAATLVELAVELAKIGAELRAVADAVERELIAWDAGLALALDAALSPLPPPPLPPPPPPPATAGPGGAALFGLAFGSWPPYDAVGRAMVIAYAPVRLRVLLLQHCRFAISPREVRDQVVPSLVAYCDAAYAGMLHQLQQAQQLSERSSGGSQESVSQE